MSLNLHGMRAKADEAGSREQLDGLTVSVSEPGRVLVILPGSHRQGKRGVGEWDGGDVILSEMYGLSALDNARLFAAADRMRQALEAVLNAFAWRADSATEEAAIVKAELALQGINASAAAEVDVAA